MLLGAESKGEPKVAPEPAVVADKAPTIDADTELSYWQSELAVSRAESTLKDAYAARQAASEAVIKQCGADYFPQPPTTAAEKHIGCVKKAPAVAEKKTAPEPTKTAQKK